MTAEEVYSQDKFHTPFKFSLAAQCSNPTGTRPSFNSFSVSKNFDPTITLFSKMFLNPGKKVIVYI